MFDTVDLSSIDGLVSDYLHVDSHYVDSYVRDDGTFVRIQSTLGQII